MSMELELTSQQRQLIDNKNELVDTTVEKYRLAGQIAQTGMAYIQALLREPDARSKTIGEICRMGDSFLQQATTGVYKKNVQEKGIALPVQIEKGAFVGGVSPEESDEFQAGYVNDGDIIKVTLGVHIDGYTAQISHSTVVWDEQPKQPLMGNEADAMVAAYLANEAVTNLVSMAVNTNNHALVGELGQVTGRRIRRVVDTIASTFRVKVAPGSRVRRIRRFLAGQSDVVQEQDFKGISWDEEEEIAKELAAAAGEEWEDEQSGDDEVVVAGEVWLVDIRMAATQGAKGVLRHKQVMSPVSSTLYKPSIFSRDYTVTYNLKLNASRQLLSRSDATTSVYPFKLSHIAESEADFKSCRLGLNEVVQHHIFVPHNVVALEFVALSALQNGKLPRHGTDVPVAREMSTVVLVPFSQSQSGFGEAIRLTGGNRVCPPSWMHSKYEIDDQEINALLTLSKEKKTTGVSFQVVQPSQLTNEMFAMEVDE